jgi:hypothetical protein
MTAKCTVKAILDPSRELQIDQRCEAVGSGQGGAERVKEDV